MSAGNLYQLVQTESVIEREGILVDKHIAEQTVWDRLAKENPTHAVISAGDEARAAQKSEVQIVELAAELNDGVTLDLGCGYGRVAKYLLPQRQLSGYIGIDSAYAMLQLFQQRYRGEQVEQMTPVLFINADIHTLPLRSASVDNVVVAAVFLHNHKSVVKQSVEEIHRVLKPGGKLFVYGSFPNKWSLMGLQGACYQMCLNIIGNPFKNGPVRYYGMREVNDLLSDFSEVDIRPTGFAILPRRLIFLPGVLGSLYRTVIADPINGVLARVLPGFVRQRFPVHYDVVASK